jgi:hypothetical protein
MPQKIRPSWPSSKRMADGFALGNRAKVAAFIEPPQGVVVEKILRHCGLWQPSSPRPPPAVDDLYGQAASANEPRERVYVDIDLFEATF